MSTIVESSKNDVLWKCPTVSFIVPCYKLAHLLPECINSIFSQSYENFEILVMDDCSPDNTLEIVSSFQDPRVKHIRNERNLGPLPNYNKGIQLCRGKYVWLISADDYLRRSYVVERYVEVMEKYPRVGYIFCPGVGVRNGEETGLLKFSRYGKRDRIINGHAFIKAILQSCFILSPSVMVRRECYEKLSCFPVDVMWRGTAIDLVWGGDWYLWALFALHHDVAYLAEPMVCYREHGVSSSDVVTRDRIKNCVSADIAVPWMIKEKADKANYYDASRQCLHAVAREYARHLTGKWYRSGTWTINFDEFEKSLLQNSENEKERSWVRARVFVEMANIYFWKGDCLLARQFYDESLRIDPWMMKVYAKRLLLSLGSPGECIWKWSKTRTLLSRS